MRSEEIGRARAPDGGELVLYRSTVEWSIRVDGQSLMSSRAHGSEEEMARLACAPLAGRERARVLVGGLGMGFTLRAVLDTVPASAEVTVCEVVPAVVEWNRGPLAPLAGNPLADQRVRVALADVGAWMRAATVRQDAILLDVDNGPAALTRKANQALYGEPGLAMAKRLLAPGGCLAVWSASPDKPFARRLRRAGLRLEVHDVPARGAAGGPKHTIFLGWLDALAVGRATPAGRARSAGKR